MNWNPNDMSTEADEPMNWERQETPDYQIPQVPPAKGRLVAAVIAGMALLAIVFSVAAHAQDATQATTQETTQATTQDSTTPSTAQATAETGTAGQQPAQKQASAADGTMQSQPASQAEPAGQVEAQVEARAPLPGQIVEQPDGTYAVSGLIGQSVYSSEGEDIGQISDLLIGDDDKVVGVILGIGGFLGIGEKPIAVEFDRLDRMTAENGDEQLVLNYTRAELEKAPQFVSLEQQRQQQAAAAASEQQKSSGTGRQPADQGQALTQ